MCHQGDYGIQDAPSAPAASTDGPPTTVLSRLAELGVRTICFHEHWTDIQNYTSTKRGTELHDLVRACHDKGIRLVLYFGSLMSDIAPEWAEYSDECLVYPRTGDYQRKPEQHAYRVCYRSVWQDFLADGIARIMDEYDIDGVYLDGTSTPFGGCANQRHGCGYTGPDGKVHPTFALFPIRETLRRIYTVVKSRKSDGQVNVHQSAFMTHALPYFTSYWDGEHLFVPKGGSAMERLSLDMFRAEFMGRQWGVPAEFLHGSLGLNMHQALAISLLHDVPARPGTVPDLEEIARVWRVFDEFGRKEAQFLPYWSNSRFVTVEPAGCYVSLYNHPTHGVLAVVSNPSGQEQTVRARFNAGALSVGMVARDAITAETIPVRDQAVEIRLASLDWRLLWLEEKLPI